jgi:hypothetical protein
MERFLVHKALRALGASVTVCLAIAGTTSCGSGGGGGGVLGDLATDLVISSDTQVSGEVRARSLTINAGAKLSSTGDLKIQAAQSVTVNGAIDSVGGVTIIAPSGTEMADTSDIQVGDGDYIIVGSTATVPTTAAINAETDLPPALDGSATLPQVRGNSRQETIWRIRPATYKPTARGRTFWVDVPGKAKIGKPGQTFTQTQPPGKDGKDGANACTSTGDPGLKGGSVIVRASSIDFDGSVVFNLGRGGNGGNATTPATCCPANATGGKGAPTGTCRMSGSGGITNAASVTVNFGGGGNGGQATATSRAGTDGCGPTTCTATATGGDGGSGAGASSASGNVTGVSNIFVGGASGGAGGAATTTGGKGGNDTCCPGQAGAKGGNATSTGGAGGPSTGTVSGGLTASGGFNGGNGGNATTTAGKGGNGNSCCTSPPAKGGDGGPGGNASATVGVGGVGTTANGTAGTVGGRAGDGGNGGNGLPIGGAGGIGTGTNVPNGNAGLPGADCPAGNCANEQEPNNTVGTATDMLTKDCAVGTLANDSDLDHFKKTLPLAAGQYQVIFQQAQPGQALFLKVGNNASSNHQALGTIPFTVTQNNTVVIFGMFGPAGAYKFTVIAVE